MRGCEELRETLDLKSKKWGGVEERVGGGDKRVMKYKQENFKNFELRGATLFFFVFFSDEI